MSGRRTATLPLPEVASGFSDDIAEKVRSSWLSEIDTAGAELELLLVALDFAPGVLLLLLLQAAAARHKATDTDATAAPFLATRIIENHLCVFKGKCRTQALRLSSQAWRTSRP